MVRRTVKEKAFLQSSYDFSIVSKPPYANVLGAWDTTEVVSRGEDIYNIERSVAESYGYSHVRCM
jgi:hypothetical protein